MDTNTDHFTPLALFVFWGFFTNMAVYAFCEVIWLSVI